MTTPSFSQAYQRYMSAFDTPELEGVAAVGVKFVPQGQKPPPQAKALDQAYTWCYAVRQASRGEIPLVTRETLGCVMAGIALGLVDEDETEPLPGWRQYTQNMSAQPAPVDFKEGRVFACSAANHQEYALYGADDPGRYQTVEAAQKAYRGMLRIQPARMDAVVAFPPEPDLSDLVPDVVILALTPRETVRTVQALTFTSGERFTSSTLGVGGFCVDLTVTPYLTGKPNASFMCVGARVMARWEGALNGLGMPWETFLTVVNGMETTRTGYPFPKYPA